MLAYIKILRPAQWLKNLLLLFPPFLGGHLLQADIFQKSAVPFAAFCLASSSTYIFNDILDANSDSYHPHKKHRPIASGQISRSFAAALGLALLLIGIWLGSLLPQPFLLFLFFYMAVTLSYSVKLKELPLIDIFCIAACFLLRLQAGGYIFGVKVSDWLFLSVFLLAMFLSAGKRLCEKRMLSDTAGNHRQSLLGYPDGFLEGMMHITGAAVLVTYTMYVIQRPALVYTVPLCTFGLLRFMLLVNSNRYVDPTESVLKDGALFIVGLLWVFLVGVATYLK